MKLLAQHKRYFELTELKFGSTSKCLDRIMYGVGLLSKYNNFIVLILQKSVFHSSYFFALFPMHLVIS